MAKIEDFFTRSQANEGRRVPLGLPDGTPTEHWLHIIGLDSDRFRRANFNYSKRLRELQDMETPEQKVEKGEELLRELQAHLVTGWSFETECTVENVANFFKEAPHIASIVDTLAGNRKFFATASMSGSPSTPKRSSNSAKGRKGRK